MLALFRLREVDSGGSWGEGVAMLHSQDHLPLAGLQQLEDGVLTGAHCVVVVDGENLVSRLDAAVQECRLVLHHLLNVDAGLVGGLVNE